VHRLEKPDEQEDLGPETAKINEMIGKELFRFGICTDVQWADLPDEMVDVSDPVPVAEDTEQLANMLALQEFSEKLVVPGSRHYRRALLVLRAATVAWNENGAQFAIHLGDIVDMRHARGRSDVKTSYDYALERAVETFSGFKRRTYHVVGNHCVRCFERAQLLERYEGPIQTYGHKSAISKLPLPFGTDVARIRCA
jgi:hypothetical protein